MQTEILGHLNLSQVYTNIFSGVNCLKVKNNYIYVIQNDCHAAGHEHAHQPLDLVTKSIEI
jgi:hypothetical protein